MKGTKTYRSESHLNREKEEDAGPDRGWTALPVGTYERKKWFFDERLRQLRNVRNPHDFVDLNDFEVEYFRKVAGKPILE